MPSPIPATQLTTDKGKGIAPQHRATLALIVLLSILVFLAMAVITPVLDPLVRQRFELSRGASALFMGANSVATLVFSPLAGVISDRWRRGRAFLLGLALAADGLLFVLLPHLPSYELLLTARFFQGVADTTAQVLLLAWALDLTNPASRGRVMAAVIAAIPVAYLLGPPLAAFAGGNSLAPLFALVGGMLVIGGGGVLLGALAGRRGGEPRHSVAEDSRPLPLALLIKPAVMLPMIFGAVDKFTFGALAILTGFVVRDVFGFEYSALAVGQLMVAFWLAFLLVSWPSGLLCDWLGHLPMLGLGSLAYGAGFLAIALLVGWENANNHFPYMIGLMAFLGVSSALMYPPSLALVAQAVEPSQRGAAMGAYNFLGTLGMTAGFAVTGVLSDRSYALAYGTAGVLEVMCAFLALALLGRVRR